MKKILLLMMSALLLTIVGYSQAPGIFNYQGVARNSVGNVLVNKSITLRLTIRDGSTAGPVVYQEARTVLTNPFGLFNVQVGSPGANPVTGTVAGVNWGVGLKFIQVEIDPNGGTTFINIGTAQVASVPYALYSNLAGDLVLPFNKTQADAGTLFKITNSGTGTGSTALEGLTNSTANNVSAIIGTVTPTGAGSSSTGVRGINNGTGGFGIGVWGSQNGNGWGVYGQTPSGLGVFGTTTSGTGVYGSASSGVGVYGNSSTGRSGFFENTNASNAAATLFVTSNGTGWAGDFISTNATTRALRTNGGVRLTGINEGLNRILTSNATGDATWQNPAAVGIVTGSGTLNYVPKWTPNGTNLGNSQIFDDGTNVGINTIAPFGKFNVNAGAQFLNSNLTGSSAAGTWLSLGNTDPGGRWFNIVTTASGNGEGPGKLVFFQGGGPSLATGSILTMVHSNLNVGINNNNPTSKLHVVDNSVGGFSNNVLLQTTATTIAGYAITPTSGSATSGYAINNAAGTLKNGQFFFATGGGYANHLVITAEDNGNTPHFTLNKTSGNIGINTTNASGKLEVLSNSIITTPQALLSEDDDDFARLSLRTNHANNSGANFWSLAGYSNDTRSSERLNFWNNASGNLMSIGGTGHVGIGNTTFSTGKLTVFAGTGTGLTSGFPAVRFQNGLSGAGLFDGLYVGYNYDGNVAAPLGLEAFVLNNEFGDLKLATFTNFSQVVLKPEGNVGVNTNTPQAQSMFNVVNYGPFDGINFQTSILASGEQSGSDGHGVIGEGEWKGLWGRAEGSGSRFQNIGVRGDAGGSNYVVGYGLLATATGAGFDNYGIYAEASGASNNNFAAWLNGQVAITDGTEGLNRVFTSDAVGNGSWQDLSAIGIVAGSGALNFVPKWTPDGVTLGNSLMQDDGTKMNIGSIFLSMDNALTIAPTPISLNASLGIIAAGGAAGLYTEDATGDLHVTLNNNDIDDGTKVMTFHDGTLNVGIGTTAPVAKLHVDNTAIGKGAVFVNQDNEIAIPAVKVHSQGPIGLDVSILASWGDNSVFAQRGDFLAGTITSAFGDAAVMAIAPNAGHGVEAASVSGVGVFAASQTGTGLRAFSNSGFAIRSLGNVVLAGIGETNGYILTTDGLGNATWQENTSLSVGISGHYLTGGLVIPDNIFTPITQWTNLIEDGGANYNPLTGEYTITKTGVYQVNAGLVFNPFTAPAAYTLITLIVNGFPEHQGNDYNIAVGSFSSPKIAISQRFNAGDVLNIEIFQNSGVNQTIPSAFFANQFSIQFIHK